MVALDYFDAIGKKWLVLVDRYSGYAWLKQMIRSTTDETVKQMTYWLNEHGWPGSMRTDGGPQYRSAFRAWCEKENITHEDSSAHNPESNLLAEAAVK